MCMMRSREIFSKTDIDSSCYETQKHLVVIWKAKNTCFLSQKTFSSGGCWFCCSLRSVACRGMMQLMWWWDCCRLWGENLEAVTLPFAFFSLDFREVFCNQVFVLRHDNDELRIYLKYDVRARAQQMCWAKKALRGSHGTPRGTPKGSYTRLERQLPCGNYQGNYLIITSPVYRFFPSFSLAIFGEKPKKMKASSFYFVIILWEREALVGASAEVHTCVIPIDIGRYQEEIGLLASRAATETLVKLVTVEVQHDSSAGGKLIGANPERRRRREFRVCFWHLSPTKSLQTCVQDGFILFSFFHGFQGSWILFYLSA